LQPIAAEAFKGARRKLFFRAQKITLARKEKPKWATTKRFFTYEKQIYKKKKKRSRDSKARK